MRRKGLTRLMISVVVAAPMVAAAGLAPMRARAMSVPMVSTGVDLTCKHCRAELCSAQDVTMPVNSGKAAPLHSAFGCRFGCTTCPRQSPSRPVNSSPAPSPSPRCWGANTFGQIGDRTADRQRFPRHLGRS